MKPALAALLCLMLSGCGLMAWRTSASESEWKNAYASRDARYTLANGKIEYLTRPADFGDAVCSWSMCIRKSEIVSVRWYQESEPNPVALGIGAGVMAIALLPYTLAVLPEIIHPSTLKQPSGATPQRITQNMYACFDPTGPSSVAHTFASDDEAAIWLRDNHWSLGSRCLMDASQRLWNTRDPYTSLQLWTLSAIRERWEYVRCEHLPYFRVTKIIPNVYYIPSVVPPGESYFRMFDELWADPRTWDYAFDLSAFCKSHGGEAFPESEWPARRALMDDAIPLPSNAS